MPEKLSAIIITLNEEKNIGKCLDAISQVADEIIIVDSYSTDSTEAICLEYGTRFVQNKFKGYIQQKDYARSLASHDLILSVDADEILSKELIESIQKVKANAEYNVYLINRLSFYVDRFIHHGHWFPDKKVRLFRKESGKWGGRNPHDQFIPNKSEKTKLLKGVVYHYTFNSIEEHLTQANKFSDIGANELSQQSLFYLSSKAIISPLWGFFYGYFFKLGFLDGWYGLTIAIISSMESYLKYSKAIVWKNQLPDSDLSIIHLSSIKKWRGGEQQVINLVEELRKNRVYNHLVVSKNSELAEYCTKHKLPHSTINYYNGFNLLAAWKIRTLSKRLKADIIHMHCSPSHTLGIISNLLGNKRRLILTRRVIFPIKANTLSVLKYNFHAIERIICVSQAIRDVLKQRIKNNALLDVIYDGVDIKKVTAQKMNSSVRTEYNLTNKTIVTIVAALSVEKDHLTFLNTASLLFQVNKNFHFLIVGTGTEEKSIRDNIRRLKLDACVTMTGFRKDIPNVLKDSDYFVLNSTMEGLGSSIIEAFANKIPVVTTKVGGIPELVIHGRTGLLADSGDAKTIANHILTLERDNSLKERLINNAYQLLIDKFKIELSASQTVKIYQDVMPAQEVPSRSFS